MKWTNWKIRIALTLIVLSIAVTLNACGTTDGNLKTDKVTEEWGKKGEMPQVWQSEDWVCGSSSLYRLEMK